jgi:hypothetical protein
VGALQQQQHSEGAKGRLRVAAIVSSMCVCVGESNWFGNWMAVLNQLHLGGAAATSQHPQIVLTV